MVTGRAWFFSALCSGARQPVAETEETNASFYVL